MNIKVEDLSGIASTLDDGASELGAMAGSAPAVPDAGTSTPAVASALAAITKLTSTVMQTTAIAGSQVRQSNADYQHTEHSNANGLRGIH